MASPPPPPRGEALEDLARARRVSIDKLIAVKKQLKREADGFQAASNRKRQQIELLARKIPEIDLREQPVRRLELLSELVDAPSKESAHSVGREAAALREELTAMASFGALWNLANYAKVCVGDKW